jgi:hypothetical protein
MIFETLLEDFRRANKAAREKLAAKFGFSTAGEYETHLLNMIEASKPKEAPTDMVIAFDTTGSMREYIGAVRTHVQETIKNLFENTPGLQLKIVAFGDYCDMSSSKEFGNAYQETQLTKNKDELIKFVRNAKDTGGGDSDEFYELVLHKILEETPWREGANKAILLIGDADPHEVGYSWAPMINNARIDWKKEAKKAASMNIRIDTLRIHEHISWYKELSANCRSLYLSQLSLQERDYSY